MIPRDRARAQTTIPLPKVEPDKNRRSENKESDSLICIEREGGDHTRREREASRIGVESDCECDDALHRSRRLA